MIAQGTALGWRCHHRSKALRGRNRMRRGVAISPLQGCGTLLKPHPGLRPGLPYLSPSGSPIPECARPLSGKPTDPANPDSTLMPTRPCIGKASDGGDLGCRPPGLPRPAPLPFAAAFLLLFLLACRGSVVIGAGARRFGHRGLGPCGRGLRGLGLLGRTGFRLGRRRF